MIMRDASLTFEMTPGRLGGMVIRLVGPLTLSNLFELQTALRNASPELMIFDLTEMPYMDSAGIGVIVNYFVSAEKRGRKMCLAGANERVLALLEMMKLTKILGCFKTVADAEANVSEE